ncbi:MAG: SDR family oxidoreductase [Actinobacteria bacterium]|nr:SDR family oxidoreductase [Actinomycetota bacterium]
MPVALITGASRGIGKSCALYLAEAGCDVALGARTMVEGEAREHSSTLKKSDTRPLPGSLETTAALVEERGQRAMPVYMDLLDRGSLEAAVERVLGEWGAIDVLVNNGRYIGPGHMDLFMDTPIELLEQQIEANVIAPMVLSQRVIPQMLERGKGVIINITSGAGYGDPPGPAGDGGWGMGYGVSKGGFHRIAGILGVELGGQGIRAHNIQPGFVATERMAMDMAEFGFDASQGAPPDVVGAVAAWLVTDPEAESMNGQNIEAQDFCRERNLVPGWSG